MRARASVGMVALICTILPATVAAAPADTPNASFTTSPSDPVVKQAVTFDGSASVDPDGDAITSYRWTFGDGGTATTTTASTTHVYAKAGTFSPTLIVVDSNGNPSAPATGSVSVSTPEAGPVARFKVTPKGPIIGQAVSYDGSKSSDKDGDQITSYRWEFGDGASQTTTSPTTTHAYAEKGTFVATLSVVDIRGNASAAMSHTIKVHAAPVYKIPKTPIAKFTFSPRKPRTGQFVRFDGGHSTGGGSSVTAYLWTFGDGTTATSSSARVYHAYAAAGTYSAQLVVENHAGRFSSPATEKLTVGRAPRLSRLRVEVCVRRSRRCPVRGLVIHFRLSALDSVTLTVTRRGHSRLLLDDVVSGGRGRNLVLVAFRGRRHEHYVLRVTPAGGRTRVRQFAWRRG